MKKLLILLLTFITLVSALSINAFADENTNDAMVPFEPSEETSVTSKESDFPSAEVSEPEISKPERPDSGKPEKPEGRPEGEPSIPTIGATPESSEPSEEKNEEAVGDVELKFTTDNMKTALTHMGLGLLGVMIVLGLIATVVVILNKTSGKKD